MTSASDRFPSPSPMTLQRWQSWCLAILAGGVCLFQLAVVSPAMAEVQKREYLVPAASPLALKRLDTASDLMQTGQWAGAFDICDLLWAEHRRHLVPAAEDRWVNVSIGVEELLSGLKEEGIKAYRARYDASANAELVRVRESGSIIELEGLIRRYPASSAARMVRWELGTTYWQGGQTEAALRTWSPLLGSGSHLEDPVAIRNGALHARLIYCHLLAGRFSEASNLVKQLQNGGRENRDEDLDISLLVEAVSRGRNNAMEARAASAGRIGGDLWSESTEHERRSGSQNVDVVPAVFEDLVVASSNHSIVVTNATTHQPAWDNGADSDNGEIYRLRDAEPSSVDWPRPFHHPAIDANGRVYARLGAAMQPNQVSLLKADHSQVVAFDLVNVEGQVAWLSTSEMLPTDQDWTFSSSPVVSGEDVYVVVRERGRESGIGIACLDSGNGEVKWLRVVGTLLAEEDPNWGREMLTVSDNQVYLHADGLIAAVDRRTGEIEWITVNHQPVADRSTSSVSGPFTSLPSGLKFITALGQNRVVILSCRDGSIVESLTLPSLVRGVAGAFDNHAVAFGQHLWGIDTTTGRVTWRFGFDDPSGYGAGRPWCYGDDVWWSTREDLFCVDLVTGLPVSRIPLANEWRRLRGGWLVPGRRCVLLSGPSSVTAFEFEGKAGKISPSP